MSSTPDRPVLNGRYEVHSRLGKGGMADVYLARDMQLNRPVAVKVLFPEFANDRNFVERFRREAQAAANLVHPGIVGVFDTGQAGTSTHYIVMEYVQGKSLADVLKTEGRLTAEQAADIGAQVAAALSFAHQRGVVHRDIKPGNILIGQGGMVKVADFGIARALNQATEQDLTQAGAVMGTATYFSPEQAQGAQPDPRSDLYSLGIVLYETVTGRPPFLGENPVAIAYKQVHDAPVPPSALAPGLPRAFEAIVMKLLAKNPAARYQTAEELRADLRRFREGQPVLADTAAAAGLAAVPAGAGQLSVVLPTAVQPSVPAGPSATQVSRAQAAYGEATQAVPRTAVYPEYPPEEPPRRTGLIVGIGVLVVSIIALAAVLVWALVGGRDGTTGARVEVPNVVGLTLAEATTTLERAGFLVTSTQVPDEAVPEGQVIAQNPAAGERAEEGSAVELQVSAGKGKVPLPSLVGLSEAQAITQLQALGLNHRSEQKESEQPAGIVIEQRPAPGEVDKGSEVVLVVSSGAAQIAVPNVVNLEQTRAAAQLTAAGFAFDVANEPSDSVPAGRVIRTEPEVNTLLPKGSTVKLIVSSGAAPVAVPDVIGLTESEATDRLQAAGFPRQVVRVDLPAGSADDGRVISQNPAGGTEAARGTLVTINVGRAAPPPTTTTTTTVPATTTSAAATTTTSRA